MYLHVPTDNVTVLEPDCAAVPRHVHTLLGWSSKPSYAYDDTLHVQCMAKYMINCNITKVARYISLWRSPAHIITWVTMCKKIVLSH